MTRARASGILCGTAAFFALFLFFCLVTAQAAMTVLVPSQPSLDRAPAPPAQPELDILFSLMLPFEHEGQPVERAQQLGALRFAPDQDGHAAATRLDLLGDIEEISYLGQKAWGVNVALAGPALYQFTAEGRPRWDEAAGRFRQDYAKCIVPVLGYGEGWQQPSAAPFEILPLSRPFGLTAPALFSGLVLLNGQPLAGAPVSMRRINTDASSPPGPWQRELAAVSDTLGRFSFVLPAAGWWGCQATASGDPLKGDDGESRQLDLGALLWLYVDTPQAPARKK